MQLAICHPVAECLKFDKHQNSESCCVSDLSYLDVLFVADRNDYMCFYRTDFSSKLDANLHVTVIEKFNDMLLRHGENIQGHRTFPSDTLYSMFICSHL